MWPEVTIRARNQQEVDCLLYALAQMGAACLAKPGFRVEVGGAKPSQILRAVRECLEEYDLTSVAVVLRTGREYVLHKETAES